MGGYIFDTNVLSVLLGQSDRRRQEVEKAIERLDSRLPSFVSSVSLGELEFGAELKAMPNLRSTLRKARDYPVLYITECTSVAYGKLKSKLAVRYLASQFRRGRPRWLEDWVDKASGKKLGIDENDLWICAQAKERGLVVVTADKGMQRIADTDAAVRLELIPRAAQP